MEKIKEFFRKLKKRVIIIVAGIGGTLVLIFSGGLQVQIPADLQKIASVQANNPRAFEIVEKLYEIYQRTSPTMDTCRVGLAPNKIGPEEDLQVLESLGYIQRFQREKWNAVIVPCDKNNQLVIDIEALAEFVKQQEPAPVALAPVSSSTQ